MSSTGVDEIIIFVSRFHGVPAFYLRLFIQVQETSVKALHHKIQFHYVVERIICS